MKMTDPMSRQLDFGYHAGTDLFLDSIMQRHPPHTNLDLTSWSSDSATGNTRTDGTGHAFVYDAWNRLAAARDGVGGTLLETYAYDGTGRRLSQTLRRSHKGLLPKVVDDVEKQAAYSGWNCVCVQ